MIIHSENDNSVPVEHGRYAHSMINKSKLEIVHNEWGHLVWIGQDSEYSIKTIIDFIEDEY